MAPDGHCPFLNRNDSRCARFFAVARLQHAFDHCFSDFATCPNYRAMLAERASLRALAPHQEVGPTDDSSAQTQPSQRHVRLNIAGRPTHDADRQSRSTQIDSAKAGITYA